MASAMPNIDTVDVDEHRHGGHIDSAIDHPIVTTTVHRPNTQRHRRGRQRTEHRQQHDQHDRQVPLLGLADVGLGGLRRRGAQRALADDVELDPAVLDLAGFLAVDADLLAQLLGDVGGAGVVEAELQREDVRAVGLGRGLLRVGHDLDAGHLRGDLLQVRDGGVHVARTRRQRAARRPVPAARRPDRGTGPRARTARAATASPRPRIRRR